MPRETGRSSPPGHACITAVRLTFWAPEHAPGSAATLLTRRGLCTTELVFLLGHCTASSAAGGPSSVRGRRRSSRLHLFGPAPVRLPHEASRTRPLRAPLLRAQNRKPAFTSRPLSQSLAKSALPYLLTERAQRRSPVRGSRLLSTRVHFGGISYVQSPSFRSLRVLSRLPCTYASSPVTTPGAL